MHSTAEREKMTELLALEKNLMNMMLSHSQPLDDGTSLPLGGSCFIAGTTPANAYPNGRHRRRPPRRSPNLKLEISI